MLILIPPEVHKGGTVWINLEHVYTITPSRLNYKGGAILLNDGFEFYVDDHGGIMIKEVETNE